MPSTRSPILVASLITIAAAGLGCSKGPQDKLAGKWVGESIDNIPPDQEGRANGWVRATTLEFRGDKLTVAIPAEEPRTGSYKVARVNGSRIAVEVSRPNGEHDEATFVLGAENQMKWEIGNERTVRFTRVASRLDRGSPLGMGAQPPIVVLRDQTGEPLVARRRIRVTRRVGEDPPGRPKAGGKEARADPPMQHLSLEDPRLTDFALGACSAAEQREVEAHLLGCEECRRLASGLGDTLARLPLGLPLQAAPPDETRGRLFASVDHLERFSLHALALSDALAVPENDARLVLHRFSDDDGWRPAPVPGVTWRKAPLGAARAGATAILARVEPGASFPRHKHLGDELTLVVQGAILDEHGRIDPGHLTARRDGSEHTITADPRLSTCLCAIVALGGIEFS